MLVLEESRGYTYTRIKFFTLLFQFKLLLRHIVIHCGGAWTGRCLPCQQTVLYSVRVVCHVALPAAKNKRWANYKP